MFKTRTDETEKSKVTELCRANKGSLVSFPDGSYKCAGVLDIVIDAGLGKVGEQR